MKPLAGIKVVELARILAGPWCGQLLADLGAEVIKIERPQAGDDTRHWGPPFVGEGSNRSAAYFHATNRGKTSRSIDIATPGGRRRSANSPATPMSSSRTTRWGALPNTGSTTPR